MNGSGFRGGPPSGSGASSQPTNPNDMAAALRTGLPALAQYIPRLESLASSLYSAGDLNPACRLLPPPHLSALQAAVAASSTMPQTTTHHSVQSALLQHLHPAAFAAAAAAAAAANHHSMAAAAASHHPLLSPFLYSSAYHSQGGAGPRSAPPAVPQAQQSLIPGHSRHPSYGPVEAPFIPSASVPPRYRYALPSTTSPGAGGPFASARPGSSIAYPSAESEQTCGAPATRGTVSPAKPSVTGGATSSLGIDRPDSRIDRRISAPIPSSSDAASTEAKPIMSGDAKQSKIANALPTQPYYPSHFMKGTVIQLASGELKRVEDLSTEDFTKSADLTSELKIDTSQVANVVEKSTDIVLLTFAVGGNKVQVTVESTVEHPFFVIGQGWSSYNPGRSRSVYGLTCKRLQIGDVCISLTHRDLVERSGGGGESVVAGSIATSSGGQRCERPSVLSSVSLKPTAYSSSKEASKEAHMTGAPGNTAALQRPHLDEDANAKKKRKRNSPVPLRRGAQSSAWTVGLLARRSATAPPTATAHSHRQTKRRRWSIA